MIEINLVPDVKQELLRARKVRSYVVSVAIVTAMVFVGIVIAITLFWGGQKVRQTLLNDSINKNEKLVKDVRDLSSALTIQNQLSSLKTQHDGKTISSRLFPLLEVINPAAPNNITISSVTVDSETKMVTIDAQAANGYEAAESFKKTILGTTITLAGAKKPVALATAVTDSNMGMFQDPSGRRILGFTFTFEYPEELFTLNDGTTTIQRPGLSNVTVSYLRVPEELFRDRIDTDKGGQ